MRGGPEHEAGGVPHGGGRGGLVEAVQQEGRHERDDRICLRRAENAARGEAAQCEEGAVCGGGRGIIAQDGQRGVQHAGEEVVGHAPAQPGQRLRRLLAHPRGLHISSAVRPHVVFQQRQQCVHTRG